MEQKTSSIQITNEQIRKKFTSQFDLVNYAISLAENMIRSGREPRLKIDSQNRAMQVIAEIATGKDLFDELIPAATVEVEEEATFRTKSVDTRNMKETGKHSESKRSRRAFVE